MSYALATLWHERARFLPGVLAVAFSALLIALQCGLLLGLFSITSIPIDHTRADLWIGAPHVLSVDLGRPVPAEDFLSRVDSLPEVVPGSSEYYLQGFAYWSRPDGGTELCMVIGSSLDDAALGRVSDLTREMSTLLTEPDTIVVDESDLDRLGIKGIGDEAEITGQRVRVVGLTHSLKSLAGPYVFCSRETARQKLRLNPDQTTYILARCRNKADAPKAVEQLREYTNLSAFTSSEFSFRSRMHWLTKTKAGIALGYAAALGLLVGAVVTYQTLSAATLASLREYAVLRALGIPRWRMMGMVLAQSFWVGVIGVALALPAVHGLAYVADQLGVKVELPLTLQGAAVGVTMVMAMLSGVLALRALRQVEPAMLLR
jgi:putative ABC transport system permease protein